MALAPVFLSASVPDPKRDQKYIGTADVTAIGEAVRALAAVVLSGNGQLVFGGHPAISPLVYLIAQRLGAVERVTIYQSEYFRHLVPPDSLAFSRLVWTPQVDGLQLTNSAIGLAGRGPSLARMRKDMITSQRFTCGVFIGGMEGVEDEYALFRAVHPAALVLPVASTGAAARILYERDPMAVPEGYREALLHDRVYAALFREILPLADATPG